MSPLSQAAIERNLACVIFAAIVAIFVYGMIAAMLGTILPDLSDRFHLTPPEWHNRVCAGRWGLSSLGRRGSVAG